MFPQSLMRQPDGVGGSFQDEPDPAQNRTPPQIFMHGNFLKNNLAKK